MFGYRTKMCPILDILQYTFRNPKSHKSKNVADLKSNQNFVHIISYMPIYFSQFQIGYNIQHWGTYIIADLDSDTKNYADRLLVTQVK